MDLILVNEGFEQGIYDIECLKPFFSYTCVDYNSGKYVQYQISPYRNQWQQIKNHYLSIKYLVTFNGLHYDDIVLNYLCSRNWNGFTNEQICKELFDCSQAVINQDKGMGDIYRIKYRKFKYVNKNQGRLCIDLFMFWSKLLRQSKKLSLKSLACAMGMSIEEMPIHWSTEFVSKEDCELLLKYNLQDCLVTKELASRKKDEINLRFYARNTYHLDCLSWDGVKLGLNILIKLYSQQNNLKMEDVMEMRTIRGPIPLSEVILPVIKFKEAPLDYTWAEIGKNNVKVFKSFHALHQEMLKQTVVDTNEISYRVIYDGTVYDVKSGGLHSYHNNPDFITPDLKLFYYDDEDCQSYYPTLGAMWEFVPNHLRHGGFSTLLLNMKNERVAVKKTQPKKAELFKLAMNGGFYGNTNNEYTPMQDRKCMLNITINGQLMLLMLCERAVQIGIRIDMANTDGVTFIIPKSKKEEFEKIKQEWQEMTRMTLESVMYEKVVRTSINDYLALGIDGKIKQKGEFIYDNVLDGSNHFTIIPLALKEYFLNNIPVETTINANKELWRFCTSQKVDKSNEVFYNGKVINHLNRYFITTKEQGGYLYKSKDGITMNAMLKDTSVYICNEDIRTADAHNYCIDRNAYIAMAKEKIATIQKPQTTLF